MTVAERTASDQQDWSLIQAEPYPLLVDGALVVPAGRATLDVVYPFTNQVVGRVYAAGAAEVDRAVAAARRGRRRLGPRDAGRAAGAHAAPGRAGRPACRPPGVPGDRGWRRRVWQRGAGNRMCIAQEEIFGPVLAVIPFETESEAVGIANDVPYGLASAVWTQSIDRALRMARALKAGQVYVNGYYSPSMHETPMAGQKQSGVGEAGLTRYLQSKAVFVKISP
jgi:acyl-CoA reductase-like NAD-dependent aldehyde dehydrogenase